MKAFLTGAVLAGLLGSAIWFGITYAVEKCWLKEYAFGEIRCGDQQWSWRKP